MLFRNGNFQVNSHFAVLVTECSFLYKMIKLHIGQTEFSAIHPIQIVQLPAVTDLMGFKSVHVIYLLTAQTASAQP